MKQTIFLSLFAIFIFATSCSVSKEIAKAETNKTDVLELKDSKAKNNKNLVLVELFTSEG